MKPVPGIHYEKHIRDGMRTRKELIADIDVWWKRLDSDRPLDGKEVARLQSHLSAVKASLRAMD